MPRTYILANINVTDPDGRSRLDRLFRPVGRIPSQTLSLARLASDSQHWSKWAFQPASNAFWSMVGANRGAPPREHKGKARAVTSLGRESAGNCVPRISCGMRG